MGELTDLWNAILVLAIIFCVVGVIVLIAVFATKHPKGDLDVDNPLNGLGKPGKINLTKREGSTNLTVYGTYVATSTPYPSKMQSWSYTLTNDSAPSGTVQINLGASAEAPLVAIHSSIPKATSLSNTGWKVIMPDFGDSVTFTVMSTNNGVKVDTLQFTLTGNARLERL